MKEIFEPIVAGNLHLKNRLVRSATWEGIAAPDGSLPEEIYKIYEELAKGGVGAVITGFTSVMDEDFYFDGMMRLSNDELIPQYQRLTDVMRRENCPALAQLALGAYYRPLNNGEYLQREPDDMTCEEIEKVVDSFVCAAKRANAAGFDGVQIHAAHFFFLSRFISPKVNHRQDEYGGNTEKRMRILSDILRGIREAAPGLHISVKINSGDFTYGGLEEEESLVICKGLAKEGIDSVEVSGNGTSVAGIRPYVNEGYFASFAAKLASEISAPVILVGGLRSCEKMTDILQNTDIALLSLSRPLICDPAFPKKLQEGKTKESSCLSCNVCYSSPSHRCVMNLC